MPSYAISRIVIIILAVIALLIATVVTVKGLIKPPIVEPEDLDKTRFLKTLSCSYAMCARNGCDYVVIDVGYLDKENQVSCYDVCHGWEKKGDTGHKCGPKYKLDFMFNDKITYKADYHECAPPCLSDAYRRLDTDIKMENWGGRILDHNEYCFNDKDENMIIGGHNYDRGCVLALLPPDIVGLCEGVLMSSSAWGVSACDWSDKSGNWIPKDRAKEDCGQNTGHIWIGSNLQSSCSPFEETDKYLSSCVFEKDQKIDVWTKVDTIDVAGLGTYYCPEIILCRSNL